MGFSEQKLCVNTSQHGEDWSQENPGQVPGLCRRQCQLVIGCWLWSRGSVEGLQVLIRAKVCAFNSFQYWFVSRIPPQVSVTNRFVHIHDQKSCTCFSHSRTCSQVFELKKQIQEKIKRLWVRTIKNKNFTLLVQRICLRPRDTPTIE